MTIKQAAKQAKRWLGSKAVAQVVTRASKPCKVGLEGPRALDIRGEGDTWDEAFENLQSREEAARQNKALRNLAQAVRSVRLYFSK